MNTWLSKNLNIAWLILAIVAISFTGLFALIITFARIPSFSVFFSADLFYRALCVHVVFAMIIWLLMFVICLWHQYLPLVRSRFDNLTFVLALAGPLLIALLGFVDMGESYLNDYVPVINHPLFWIGLILFIVSFIFSIIKFVPFAKGLFRRSTEGQLVVYSLFVALVMLSTALLSFYITVPIDDRKLYYLRIFWVPGHIQQFLNAFILLIAWHFLVRKSNMNIGENTQPNVWIRFANGLLFLALFPMCGGFFVDPVSPFFKLITVFVYGVGLGVPVLIHTVFLVRNVRLGNFAGNTFLFSVIMYYLGICIAYGGMNSDLRITAHYHGVVAALTMALMGITFFILKENNLLKYEKLARIQPVLFSVGMIMLILCLFFAGHYGAPRKTFGFNWIVNSSVLGALNFMAIGATLSVIGGIIFIFYSICSLFRITSVSKTVLAGICIVFLSCSFKTPDEEKHLGTPVENVRVFDSRGRSFFLTDLMQNKPVILSPVYTKCPHACSVITGNLKEVIDDMDGLGKDFLVITFSFDSTDTPHDLKKFEERWKLDSANWKMVSANGEELKKLLSSIDFEIEWNNDAGQYDHPNLVVIVTPGGKISRYVYGVTPVKRDLTLSLLEARNEQSSLGVFDGLLIRCFSYDPLTKNYVMDRGFITSMAIGSVTISVILLYLLKIILGK